VISTRTLKITSANNMKYSILSILILMSFIISCNDGVMSFEINRIIENKSGLPVEIRVFFEESLVETLNLNDTDLSRKEGSCSDNGDRFFCNSSTGRDLDWTDYADSIAVVFNKESVNSFCGNIQNCTFDDRNLLLLPFFLENDQQNTGYIKSIVANAQVYTFTITEEDYENAIPIED